MQYDNIRLGVSGALRKAWWILEGAVGGTLGGLAAKHGAALRGHRDGVDLVALARRIAVLRLDGADVVMALRIQRERLADAYFPSVREYAATFGIDRAKLRFAKDDAIVMHPGPVNRGVELAHDLADHRPSVILDQVRNGVALRMAVLYLFAGRMAQSERGEIA